MKKTPLALLCLALALPGRADLVGLYAFDGANPLDAVIGSPAKEGVAPGSNKAVVLSDTMSTLTMVTDAAVLGDRTGVISVPSRSTVAIPNPGLQKDWTIAFWFYVPNSATWRCFFQFSAGNSGDGSLFIHNNTEIGASSYTTGLSGMVGAWHQLVVSSANNTQTVWFDNRKLDQSRGWNIAGMSLLQFSLDNDGEDATMYFDEIRLYDETAPAEVFPSGVSNGPVLLTPWAETPYTDAFASFSRTPDRVIDDAPYRTYVFSRHGTFTFTPVRRRDGCSALFVGGGGAGGLQRGGGGGGGGVVSASDLSFLPQPYTATVGAGGIPAVHTYWYSDAGNDGRLHEGVTPATACGGDTTLAIGSAVLHIAHGGGGGGNFNYAGSNKPSECYGLAGASGGGSAGQSTVRAAGIDGEGYAGGAATTNGDNSSGGGGGAGAAGADGTQSDPGAGGAGVESAITGAAVVYGGGGGAGGGYNGSAVGAGGAGGGGTGVSSASGHARTTAANGTDGLGGGGGGGSGQNNNPYNSMGGRGGDGAMVLRIRMVDVSDPDPLVAVYTTEVGYTGASFDVRLLSLGDGAGSAGVTLRLSEYADMSNPFFTTNLAEAASTAPVSFALSYAPLRANTTYYAQAVAENDLGIGGSSSILAFRTLDPRPVFSANIDTDHIVPDVSLSFTDIGWGNSITKISILVSTFEDFSRPDITRILAVDLSTMPTNLAHIALAGLPDASPLYFSFTAENSRGYKATVERSVDLSLGGDNVWSGLSEDIHRTTAYAFAGGLPAPGKTLYFTSPAGLSPIIDEDVAMPLLHFTSGQNDALDTSYHNGYHSCGYDLAGSGVLIFADEAPILQTSKGTNVVRNPILFSRSNSQKVSLVSSNGRLDLTGELSLPFGVTNTTMFVNGSDGEIHFGGPSPDFMGTLHLNGNLTLSLDSPFAMTNVNQIYFCDWHGSYTSLKNNTGAPMTFPRCVKMNNTTGWSSTRVIYTGAPFIFPVGTLDWCPRSGGTLEADLLVKNLVVSKHGSNGSAELDKTGNGTLAVMGTTSWSAQDCKHSVRISSGCFWPQTAAGLPPSGEIYAARDSAWQGTLGLNADYRPMLDGSSTPRIFQSSKWASWGFTGFGGDHTVCWNADPTLNLTNTTGGAVAIPFGDAAHTNADGKAYSDYYAYPAYFMFGNRSEFADGTVLFLNPIRYELGQEWDAKTFFESTNHVVAARLRGSLRLGSRNKTWNFTGRKFGGYLALEADNTDFYGKINVYEKGNLLVNSNLVARSVAVQAGSGLGGTGTLGTEDGTTVQSGGALFGGEWNKGGFLALGGKVTLAAGSALRAEFGPSNDRVGFVKLAEGSTLKLTAPIYVDVDTDPRVSPIRGVPRKLLDWSEASFDSGSAPTRADFVARPESNSDIRSIYLFVEDDALWVNYASVRTPPPTVMLLR